VKAAEIQRISQKGGATCGRTNDNVDLDKTCEEFKAVENMGVELIMCDKFPPCALPEEHQQYAGACDFGYTNGTVDMHGNLGRCGCETDYLLGNILEKDIQELWNSAPQLADWRNKKHLDKVCRRCPDLNDCGGACCLTRPGEYSPDILRPGLGTLRRRYFGR
ncbi:MAG: SPASM domain-containing protein, partial [Alphaproteobacteria bacterium]|nr:SPASM domain-containing protein [Alphaproteobacteria bacterium]